MHNVLFLCTGNSARSIMAEVLLRSLGAGRYTASSAGSQPTGVVNPGAIRQLERKGHDIEGLRSKSWDEFSESEAQQVDIVITVCDNAANESCPVWNGSPLTAHWGIPDPAAVSEPDEAVAEAFDMAYNQLKVRIDELLAMDTEHMPREEMQSILGDIGSRAR